MTDAKVDAITDKAQSLLRHHIQSSKGKQRHALLNYLYIVPDFISYHVKNIAIPQLFKNINSY